MKKIIIIGMLINTAAHAETIYSCAGIEFVRGDWFQLPQSLTVTNRKTDERVVLTEENCPVVGVKQ